MRFTETRVKGAFVIEPEPKVDDRGFFARVWSRQEFARLGLNADFVDCNNSYSVASGTLRGLHYQVAPYGEVKLVRCIRGAIFDVLVDLRRDSETYLTWFGIELSAEGRAMVYVPEGCAHGYMTLEDGSEVIYPASQGYHPEAERGLRWNDPLIAIQWPNSGPKSISAKDQRWPDYVP